MAFLFGNHGKKINIVDAVYPIGSIYLSVNNVNPSNFLGGGWEAWGSGRVPVGVNTSDTDFNTVEKTGGAKTVELTEENIPRHTHYSVSSKSGSYSIDDTSHPGQLAKNNLYSTYGAMGASASLAATSAYGGKNTGTPALPNWVTESHNNLQPYITCYMWKRVS